MILLPFLASFSIWPIWFLVLPSLKTHVCLCTFLWLNVVDLIRRLFDTAKSTSRSPLSLHCSRRLCTPLFVLNASSLPISASKSPSSSIVSCLGIVAKKPLYLVIESFFDQVFLIFSYNEDWYHGGVITFPFKPYISDPFIHHALLQ